MRRRLLIALLTVGLLAGGLASAQPATPESSQEEALELQQLLEEQERLREQLNEEGAVVVDPAVSPEVLEPPVEQFYLAEVVEVLAERREDFTGYGIEAITQEVRLRFEEGPRRGEETEAQYGVLIDDQKLTVGQRVIVTTPQESTFIFDQYRLPALGLIVGLFAVLAVVFAGWRGAASLLGLAVSVVVLVFFVVPQIIAGRNPLLISLVGAFVIGTVSIYLAHGFNRRTSVAVVSTLLTAALAIGLATVFVSLANLSGSGSEEAFFLQTAPVGRINLSGLLLGGIVIGALGVLDDITTSQTAAVYQIWRANPRLSRRELFKRGTAVGREHITSLVNTLALAYVGAALPALLLFTVYERPWWVVANTEVIAEEVIRTLVGSMALMFAVPITTLLAARFVSQRDAGAVTEAASDQEGPAHHRG